MNIQLSIDPSALNETQLQCFITFVQSFLDTSPLFTKSWDERQLEEKLAKVTASTVDKYCTHCIPSEKGHDYDCPMAQD